MTRGAGSAGFVRDATQIESEREARRCLRSASAAGLTAGEWAREHGIDGRSLNAWRINLSRSSSERDVTAPLRLVELVPTAMERSDARYLVRVGVLAIEVDADFDEATRVRLVPALRSC